MKKIIILAHWHQRIACPLGQKLLLLPPVSWWPFIFLWMTKLAKYFLECTWQQHKLKMSRTEKPNRIPPPLLFLLYPKNWIQGLGHGKQVLYHCLQSQAIIIPSHFWIHMTAHALSAVRQNALSLQGIMSYIIPSPAQRGHVICEQCGH